MEITCKCGRNMIDIVDNGRYIRCSECRKVYDYDGGEVEIHDPSNFGEKIFIKDNKILAPRIVEYRGSYLDDGMEDY